MPQNSALAQASDLCVIQHISTWRLKFGQEFLELPLFKSLCSDEVDAWQHNLHDRIPHQHFAAQCLLVNYKKWTCSSAMRPCSSISRLMRPNKPQDTPTLLRACQSWCWPALTSQGQHSLAKNIHCSAFDTLKKKSLPLLAISWETPNLAWKGWRVQLSLAYKKTVNF